MPKLLDNWIAERKRLYHEWEFIEEVEASANVLVEELRARRDGQAPRPFDLPILEEAIRRVR